MKKTTNIVILLLIIIVLTLLVGSYLLYNEQFFVDINIGGKDIQINGNFSSNTLTGNTLTGNTIVGNTLVGNTTILPSITTTTTANPTTTTANPTTTTTTTTTAKPTTTTTTTPSPTPTLDPAAFIPPKGTIFCGRNNACVGVNPTDGYSYLVGTDPWNKGKCNKNIDCGKYNWDPKKTTLYTDKKTCANADNDKSWWADPCHISIETPSAQIPQFLAPLKASNLAGYNNLTGRYGVQPK